MSWQVREPDQPWRLVDAPFEWHHGRITVDWPEGTANSPDATPARNVSFESVTYPPARTRYYNMKGHPSYEPTYKRLRAH